jgi:hypothetical protein
MDNGREELFSMRVPAGSRTYFFDVKRSREGFRYLVISEARRSESGTGYEHDRVMVFEEHATCFAEAFERALICLTAQPESQPEIVALLSPPEGLSASESETGQPSDKAYDVAEIRERYPQAYAAWTDEEDTRLWARHLKGATIPELVEEFGRQPGGIRSRLRKLAQLQVSLSTDTPATPNAI